MRHVQGLPGVDPAKVFLMGQSEGRSDAARLAAHPLSSAVKNDVLVEVSGQLRFAAIVAYYPWCVRMFRSGSTRLCSFSPVKRMTGHHQKGCFWHKAVVKGAPYDAKIYEDAHHSFDLPMPVQRYVGYTVGGHPAAAADSRTRMIAWFREDMR